MEDRRVKNPVTIFLANVASHIGVGGGLVFSLSVFYNYTFFKVVGEQYLSALTLLDHVSINLGWLLPSIIFLFVVLWAVQAFLGLLSPEPIVKGIPAIVVEGRTVLAFLLSVLAGLLFYYCEGVTPLITFSDFYLKEMFLAVSVVFGIKTIESAILWATPKASDTVLEFVASIMLKLVLLAFVLLFIFRVYEKGKQDARIALDPKNAKSHIVFTQAFPCADPQLNKDSEGNTTMTGVAILMNLERGVMVYRPGGSRSSMECDNTSIDKFNLVHFIPWENIHDIMSVTVVK